MGVETRAEPEPSFGTLVSLAADAGVLKVRRGRRRREGPAQAANQGAQGGAARAERESAGAPRHGQIDRLTLSRVLRVLPLLLAACGAAQDPCALSSECPAPLACDRGRCEDPTKMPSPDQIAARRHRLAPASDATALRGEAGRTPLGGHDFLVVGGSGAESAWRAYLRFDLESLGPAPRVTRADLVLQARDDTPALPRGSVLVGIHRAARPWNAASITWASQPGPADRERALVRVPTARRLRIRVDLTSLVRDWLRRVHPNQGLVLVARDESANLRAIFHSSESPDERSRPALEVFVR